MTISQEGKGPQVKMASTLVDQVPPIARDEARALAATENELILSLLQSLRSDDWGKLDRLPGMGRASDGIACARRDGGVRNHPRVHPSYASGHEGRR